MGRIAIEMVHRGAKDSSQIPDPPQVDPPAMGQQKEEVGENYVMAADDGYGGQKPIRPTR